MATKRLRTATERLETVAKRPKVLASRRTAAAERLTAVTKRSRKAKTRSTDVRGEFREPSVTLEAVAVRRRADQIEARTCFFLAMG